MPGNLNLKKSWHPGLHKNQEAVWKKEQEALEEKKKIDERQKEIKREREREELQRLQDEATGKKRVKRVEWMYGVAADSKATEQEDYLLGRKKIELKEPEGLKEIDDNARFEKRTDSGGGDDNRMEATVMKDDPLMQIQQKEREHGARLHSSRSSGHSSRHSSSRRSDDHHRSSRHSSSRHSGDRHRSSRHSSSRHSSSRHANDRYPDSSRRSSSRRDDRDRDRDGDRKRYRSRSPA